MDEDITGKRNMVVVGIMGGHNPDERVEAIAEKLGAAIAEMGYVLLTGGGPGVMRAASKGARRGGGLVLGILPNDRQHPAGGYPNEFVDIAIYTGMGDARNVINAKTPHVMVALQGAFGTISEIALAIKAGTPVIAVDCMHCSCLEHEVNFYPATSCEDVISIIKKIVRSQ